MKRILSYIFVCSLVCIIGIGCGSDNKKSPYDAPAGAQISSVDDIDIESFGGGGTITYWLYVTDDGEPLNSIDVGLVFFVRPDVSNYAWDFKLVDLVDIEEVEYWDDDKFPHFKTDKRGSLVVDIYVPFGFSGEMDVVFDIGVATAQSLISIIPKGTECFDGEDNDDDGGTDFWDPECTSPFDLLEAASTV